MNKIFSVLLLVTFSFGIISCSNEDPSGATSQLGQVLDQPNSTDDRNIIDLPVITLDSCFLIDNSTIDNSTVDKSSISDNSSIKDSTVINCSTVSRSIVDNSTIDNSTICDSYIDNSTIYNSTVCYENVSFSIINRIMRNQIMTEQTDPTASSVAITSATGLSSLVWLNAGDNVSVTATFSEPVIVDNASGTPTLTIVVGSDNRTATYVSGSGNPALVFQYTIQSGDNDTNGISIGADSLYSYEYVGQLCTQTGVCDPGFQTMGGIISKSQVQGDCSATPDQCIGYVLDPGRSWPARANLLSDITPGCYSMSCSDSWPIYLRSTALSSGTIRDTSGNYATITHSAVDNNSSYKVDNTDPTLVDNVSITGSTSNSAISQYKIPANGDLCDGSAPDNGKCYIYVTATFNENVTVTGSPQLTIVVGSTNRTATYTSGSGNPTLVFRYAILINDSLDTNGISIDNATGISLNGGTITDLAGNDAATLTFSSVGDNADYQVKNW